MRRRYSRYSQYSQYSQGSQCNPRTQHNRYLVQSAREGVMEGCVKVVSASTREMSDASESSESESESDSGDDKSDSTFFSETRQSSKDDLQSKLQEEIKLLKDSNSQLQQEYENLSKKMDAWKVGIKEVEEKTKRKIQELKDKLFVEQNANDMLRENYRKEKESNASLYLEIQNLTNEKQQMQDRINLLEGQIINLTKGPTKGPTQGPTQGLTKAKTPAQPGKKQSNGNKKRT